MTPYEKELVYTKRDTEGMITDVFDPKTNKYLKVINTAITIDSGESSEPDSDEERLNRINTIWGR